MAKQGSRDSEWLDVDSEHLSARLRFNPDDAHIWLEGQRMLLIHLGAFARLRQELVEQLGIDTARLVLERIGAVSGTLDAAMARRAMPRAGAMESFKTGPRLHAIEGMVLPEEVRLEIDPESGFHAGEWIWRHSAEAEAHLQVFGTSPAPVCWTQIGYASAYSSAFMDRPILYREVECKAMGAAHCRIIGRPAALWEDGVQSGSQLAIELGDRADQADPLLEEVAPDLPASMRAPSAGMVGTSPEFASMMHAARRFADIDAPLLLLGEPGAGKRSLAGAIHAMSTRKARRILSVRCSTLDEEALEVELFGRDRTLSGPARQGIFERAAGGTVLVEDIEAMPPRCQARLLDLLRTGEVLRKGETTPRPANVRIVACGTRDLLDAARAGRFREDLYLRLSICPIEIPPLRERRADLPMLIRHFMEKFAHRHRKRLSGMTMDGVSHLLTHELPGNVAELESLIERAVIAAPDGSAIGVAHLTSAADLRDQRYLQVSRSGTLIAKGAEKDSDDPASPLLELLLRGECNIERLEADLIRMAVSQSNGNLAKAAKMLGLTRPQLAYRYGKL